MLMTPTYVFPITDTITLVQHYGWKWHELFTSYIPHKALSDCKSIWAVYQRYMIYLHIPQSHLEASPITDRKDTSCFRADDVLLAGVKSWLAVNTSNAKEMLQWFWPEDVVASISTLPIDRQGHGGCGLPSITDYLHIKEITGTLE